MSPVLDGQSRLGAEYSSPHVRGSVRSDLVLAKILGRKGISIWEPWILRILDQGCDTILLRIMEVDVDSAAVDLRARL